MRWEGIRFVHIGHSSSFSSRVSGDALMGVDSSGGLPTGVEWFGLADRFGVDRVGLAGRRRGRISCS